MGMVCRRYNLQLKDENEDRRKHSWYERDSYEDKWSDRWHWLRRKYNRDSSRTVSEIQAPVAASPTPYVEEAVIEELVVTPASPVESPVMGEPESAAEPASQQIETDLYPVK